MNRKKMTKEELEQYVYYKMKKIQNLLEYGNVLGPTDDDIRLSLDLYFKKQEIYGYNAKDGY
jgi:hypothetical protein